MPVLPNNPIRGSVSDTELVRAIAQLNLLTEAQKNQSATPGNVVGIANGRELQQLERSFTPLSRALAAGKWTIGALAFGAATIFGTGQWSSKNAMKTDLDVRVIPIEKRVETIEIGMKPLVSGMKTLVTDRNNIHNLRLMRRKLQTHEREFDEALQAWKRGRRRGSRPRKSPEHLRHIDDLKVAEEKI